MIIGCREFNLGGKDTRLSCDRVCERNLSHLGNVLVDTEEGMVDMTRTPRDLPYEVFNRLGASKHTPGDCEMRDEICLK